MSLDWVKLENPVAQWWIFLCIVATFNIAAWFLTRKNILQKIQTDSNYSLINKKLLFFSSLYVFGCAFRSYIPRADVQKMTFFDTWIASVFLGRSVATIAELAFVIQWAIVLHFYTNRYDLSLGKKISLALVPIIFTAECFSWYAVITTNYIGNSVEESLWAVTYSLIIIILVMLFPKVEKKGKQLISLAIFGCLCYVTFMVTVDVPMYLGRLADDTANGKVYLGIWEGLVNLNTNWVISYDINEWRTEIPWMSGYFSFAVWSSILLCYLPFPKKS